MSFAMPVRAALKRNESLARKTPKQAETIHLEATAAELRETKSTDFEFFEGWDDCAFFRVLQTQFARLTNFVS